MWCQQPEYAKSIGVDERVVRRWKKEYPELVESLAKSRATRRIRQPKDGDYPDIEKLVEAWIVLRNSRGLTVKDKIIRWKALAVRDELAEKTVDPHEKESILGFRASKMWCYRFKKRKGFVSRRHTTTHSLPGDFREQSIAFIEHVKKMCDDYGISRDHIINFDQVPRYFESNMSTTITRIGTREVRLRKSSTSHKRFTFTAFITASGKVLYRHALFSGLVKMPKHHPRSNVSLNVKGMWNSAILKDSIDKVATLARSIFDKDKHLFFIFDSYGVHLKFVRENGEAYKQQNIHFAIIPARLTGLLQPLDVALNRSFQQSFNDKSCAYHEDAVQTVSKILYPFRDNNFFTSFSAPTRLLWETSRCRALSW